MIGSSLAAAQWFALISVVITVAAFLYRHVGLAGTSRGQGLVGRHERSQGRHCKRQIVKRPMHELMVGGN